MGNQAVQRYLRGQIPAVLMPELVKAYQPWLHPTGAWRQYAVPQGEPEVQGLPALPSGADLSLLQPAAPVRSESDQFIVSSNEFGVTIFHPWSDTRIRIVEKEHRYKPEAWTYETRKWPNVEEPAPNRFAREWELPNSLSSLSGGFQVTIIEMSDNMFVPLPNEPIDVGTLLQVGKPRDPDKHIWRGALTRSEYLQFWIGLGLGLAFGAIEFAVGVVAASAAAELATEATGLLSELAEAGIAPELGELAPEAADVATDVAMAADFGPSVTEGVGAQAAETSLAAGSTEQRLITGGLLRHEAAGGHPLMEHVGLDNPDLYERLATNHRLREASTFTDIETAHDAVAEVLEENAAEIEHARLAQTERFVVHGRYSRGIVGRWLARGADAPIDVSGVRVILDADPTVPWGFRIQLAYPEP